jgi:hypothetical protein
MANVPIVVLSLLLAGRRSGSCCFDIVDDEVRRIISTVFWGCLRDRRRGGRLNPAPASVLGGWKRGSIAFDATFAGILIKFVLFQSPAFLLFFERKIALFLERRKRTITPE